MEGEVAFDFRWREVDVQFIGKVELQVAVDDEPLAGIQVLDASEDWSTGCSRYPRFITLGDVQFRWWLDTVAVTQEGEGVPKGVASLRSRSALGVD